MTYAKIFTKSFFVTAVALSLLPGGAEAKGQKPPEKEKPSKEEMR